MLPIVRMTEQLLLAAFLGGLIGWERERHERPAGLRTHILVCVGSTLITLVSNSFPDNGGRIAAQIVTGVGFLGAGTIIRDNAENGGVRGLTTAASLWAIAGIGIAVGFGGQYAQLASIGTAIILFTLTILNQLEDKLNRRRKRQALMLVLRGEGGEALDAVSRVLEKLHDKTVRTRGLRLEKSADSMTAHVQVSLPHGISREALNPIFTSDHAILHFNWSD